MSKSQNKGPSEYERNLKNFQQRKTTTISVQIDEDQYQLQVNLKHTIKNVKDRFQRNKYFDFEDPIILLDNKPINQQETIQQLLKKNSNISIQIVRSEFDVKRKRLLKQETVMALIEKISQQCQIKSNEYEKHYQKLIEKLNEYSNKTKRFLAIHDQFCQKARSSFKGIAQQLGLKKYESGKKSFISSYSNNQQEVLSRIRETETRVKEIRGQLRAKQEKIKDLEKQLKTIRNQAQKSEKIKLIQPESHIQNYFFQTPDFSDDSRFILSKLRNKNMNIAIEPLLVLKQSSIALDTLIKILDSIKGINEQKILMIFGTNFQNSQKICIYSPNGITKKAQTGSDKKIKSEIINNPFQGFIALVGQNGERQISLLDKVWYDDKFITASNYFDILQTKKMQIKLKEFKKTEEAQKFATYFQNKKRFDVTSIQIYAVNERSNPCNQSAMTRCTNSFA